MISEFEIMVERRVECPVILLSFSVFQTVGTVYTVLGSPGLVEYAECAVLVIDTEGGLPENVLGERDKSIGSSDNRLYFLGAVGVVSEALWAVAVTEEGVLH